MGWWKRWWTSGAAAPAEWGRTLREMDESVSTTELATAPAARMEASMTTAIGVALYYRRDREKREGEGALQVGRGER